MVVVRIGVDVVIVKRIVMARGVMGNYIVMAVGVKAATRRIMCVSGVINTVVMHRWWMVDGPGIAAVIAITTAIAGVVAIARIAIVAVVHRNADAATAEVNSQLSLCL